MLFDSIEDIVLIEDSQCQAGNYQN